jgi:hypothetical protein
MHRAVRALSLALLGAVAVFTTATGAASPGGRAIARDIRDADGFTHTFYSDRSIHPPIVWLSGRDPDPRASGDIFLDAHRTIQSGPMILGPDGQLIWFDPVPDGKSAYNLAVQSYDGQTVLTMDQGGTDVILNHSYQTVASVLAGNGYTTGVHEFELTPQGTALITAYAFVPANLSSIGGPKHGILTDDAIQEIDISTGQVLWQWSAAAHVSPGASYAGKPGSGSYDFFHLDSVQQLPNGNLLISARHTWAIYEIDKQTGKIIWTLGGKHSSFKMGPGTSFKWQHDARLQPDGTLTVFDDGAGLQASEQQSRALRIRLNYQTHTATLVHAYTHNPPVLAYSQGNEQLLADGNTFVGYGSKPYAAEFGRTGRQLFTIRFDPPVESYRAYRFQWLGQPASPPSVAAAPTRQGTRVYASWNGATDVAFWRILAGPTTAALNPGEQFRKTSFETEMWMRSKQPYFAVQALGGDGQVLATSSTVRR